MFTGLVLERGRLSGDPAPGPRGGVVLRLMHGAALGERLPVGASVAVAGVCLTVVEQVGQRSQRLPPPPEPGAQEGRVLHP